MLFQQYSRFTTEGQSSKSSWLSRVVLTSLMQITDNDPTCNKDRGHFMATKVTTVCILGALLTALSGRIL